MGILNNILEIAAPATKEAAKGVVKLTGKGLLLAGKGIKEVGSRTADRYKEKKVDQIEEKLSEFNEKYCDGTVLCAFDSDTWWDKRKVEKLGIGQYIKNAELSKLAKILVDDNTELRYKIFGNYDSTIKRYFTVHDHDGNKIGSVNEHSKLFGYPYESIKYGGTIIGELNHEYYFSNTSYIVERIGSVFSPKHFIVHNIVGVIMEIAEVRGQELIAIADKDHMDECVLLYTAIDLIWHPKPDLIEDD